MKIIVTIGNCNGIGLEVFYKSIFKLAQQNFKDEIAICGNIQIIEEYFSKMKFDYKIEDYLINISGLWIKCISTPAYCPVNFAVDSELSGKTAAESLDYAVQAVSNKEFDAIVTLPISKYSMQLAGWDCPGHTEYLARKCGVETPMMILFDDKLRIALATIHTAIKDVAGELNIEKIKNTIQMFNNSLKSDFAIPAPKLAVLGLNPHSGEQGKFGSEEIEIIEPAIKQMKDSVNVSGAFPSDGFFGFGDYKKYDGVIAMYHDQGLIPLKLLCKGAGVNFTANLPFVRTSPDHGTGFSIAGKNVSSESSTLMAIKYAGIISNNRKKR